VPSFLSGPENFLAEIGSVNFRASQIESLALD